MVIYFHKNGDDLGKCKVFVDKFSASLKVHVLVVEYPGYGLCWDRPKNAEELSRHAMAALGFTLLVLRWPMDSILMYGTCIGVGPAIVVGTQAEVAGLVLVGAFLSLKKMVRCHSRLAAYFVTESFPNEERAPLIKSPTLIFHGEQDKLVPVAHAEELHKKFQCSTKLVSLGDLGHHANMLQDEKYMLAPIREFFQLPGSTNRELRIPSWAFQRMEALRTVANADNLRDLSLPGPNESGPGGAEQIARPANAAAEEETGDKRSL